MSFGYYFAQICVFDEIFYMIEKIHYISNSEKYFFSIT